MTSALLVKSDPGIVQWLLLLLFPSSLVANPEKILPNKRKRKKRESLAAHHPRTTAVHLQPTTSDTTIYNNTINNTFCILSNHVIPIALVGVGKYSAVVVVVQE